MGWDSYTTLVFELALRKLWKNWHLIPPLDQQDFGDRNRATHACVPEKEPFRIRLPETAMDNYRPRL